MEMFTAKTYENMERIGQAYEINGRMYTKVTSACSKCGGTGVYSWGTGMGSCFRCSGSGLKNEKVVRLYTKAERASLDKAAEAKKMNKEELARLAAPSRIKEWKEKNAFDEDLVTYVAFGNSYPFKEELKDLGFKYGTGIGWHRSEACSEDFDGIVFRAVNCSDSISFDEFGTALVNTEELGNLFSSIQDELFPKKEYKYYGHKGEKFVELEATLEDVRGYQTRYGWTNIYAFSVGEARFVWFTSTAPLIKTGETVKLSGTIKEHSDYNGVKQTVVTRCKVGC